MKKVLEWSEKAIYFMSGLFILVICFSVNIQVFTRTFLGKALTWPEEVASFC